MPKFRITFLNKKLMNSPAWTQEEIDAEIELCLSLDDNQLLERIAQALANQRALDQREELQARGIDVDAGQTLLHD